MKKAISWLALLGLLLASAHTALAGGNGLDSVDPTPAVGRLMDLGILTGDGPFRLSDPMTRAEMMVFMVRAFGRETEAGNRTGEAAYPDVAKHWASGYVAAASELVAARGFTLGFPDGTFHPDDRVTYAQTVAFLMKFMSIAPDSTTAWPDNALAGAATAGLITTDERKDIAAAHGTAAPRGWVFYLADRSFYSFQLSPTQIPIR